MIPKIIHYCWFGGNPKSGLILSCIESWKKYLPDYEIREWNEETFDVNCNTYVRQAYEAKKWAFVSDYARLHALYNYGGIYLDTDVEVLKNLDCFLDNEAFTGFEAKDSPITAVMGTKAGNPEFKDLLDYYNDKTFIKEDGSYDITTNTTIISGILKNKGIVLNGKMQKLDSITIYPQIYFCPNNFSRIWNMPSKKSYAIHHFDQSWKSDKKDATSLPKRIRRYALGWLRNQIGTDGVVNLKGKIVGILGKNKV